MMIQYTKEEWEISKKSHDRTLPEEERLKYEKQWDDIRKRYQEKLKDCPFAH